MRNLCFHRRRSWTYWERLEAGETLSAEEQSWVDAKLDRIDELMQKLGLSYDDDEEEEEDEKQEDMMRLLRGN